MKMSLILPLVLSGLFGACTGSGTPAPPADDHANKILAGYTSSGRAAEYASCFGLSPNPSGPDLGVPRYNGPFNGPMGEGRTWIQAVGKYEIRISGVLEEGRYDITDNLYQGRGEKTALFLKCIELRDPYNKSDHLKVPR
jgi:hypothetical protein